MSLEDIKIVRLEQKEMHTTSYHMNRQGDRSGSPNKRWQTTARSAAEDVASQLQGSYDRASMVKGLTERKMANTKTSISFGNEKVLLWLFCFAILVIYFV